MQVKSPQASGRKSVFTSAPVCEGLETRRLFSWIGATSGTTDDAAHNYNNPANWTGGVIGNSFSGTTLTGNTTLYLTSNVSTGSSGLNLGYSGNYDLTLASSSSQTRTLTLNGAVTGDFGGSANSRTVSIGAPNAAINVSLNGGTRTINVQAGDDLRLVDTVGNGSFVKQGTGALDLDSNNFISGSTLLGGQTNFYKPGSLGSNTINLDGGTLHDIGAGTLANTIKVMPGAISYIRVDGGNLIYSGNLTGNGTIERIGSSSLYLSGNNSGFTGTYINAAARTRFLSPSAGSASANWEFTASTESTFDFSNGTIEFGSISGSSPIRVNTGYTGVTLSVGYLNSSTTYSGVIYDQGPTSDLALAKVGSGSLTLTNANTYTGGTTIYGGSILADNTTGSATGSGPIYVYPGASISGTGYYTGPVVNV